MRRGFARSRASARRPVADTLHEQPLAAQAAAGARGMAAAVTAVDARAVVRAGCRRRRRIAPRTTPGCSLDRATWASAAPQPAAVAPIGLDAAGAGGGPVRRRRASVAAAVSFRPGRAPRRSDDLVR